MMKNKFFSCFLSVLLCVCVLFSSFTLTSFAIDVPDFNDVLDTQFSNWSELPEDFKNLGNAYVDLFTNSDSPAKFFSNAADIPISWFKILADGTPVLNPVSSLFFWLDGQGSLFANDLNDHRSGHYAGRHRDDFSVPVVVAKDHITESNTLYYPKNTAGKMTFRTDERWKNAVVGGARNAKYEYSAFYEGKNGFVACGGSNDMYIVLYYKTDTDSYYSQYQLHFVMTVNENWYEDRDEIESYSYTLTCKYWDMLGSSEDAAEEVTVFENSDYSYFAFEPFSDSSRFYLTAYNGYLNYLSFKHQTAPYFSLPVSVMLLKYDNISSSLGKNGLNNHFFKIPSEHDETCTLSGKCDIGYIASKAPIETSYRIDVSRIPDNYYITVQGDTLYDYSITNPETGQSDTINNYITNNYTYVTNNEGDNSGSGSGVGSNVTVGGKVDIGGSVDVDINVSIPDININVNTSNGAGTGTDYSAPDTDIFNSYYGEALDDSSDFRRFIEEFFGFLPPEITLLLGIGLTFVILARLFGR